MLKTFGISSPNSVGAHSLFEDFKIFLPKYLSDEDQENLFKELQSFPNNIDARFYTNRLRGEVNLYQGDAYHEIMIPDYERGKFTPVKGFLISNSCDACAENRRPYRPYLSFAPIFDLQKYKNALMDSGQKEATVQAHIDAIKKQSVTSFFYLPHHSSLGQECFVRFDCIFSLPASFYEVVDLFKRKIFTLSDYGFYMLLFKLAVHFTRVQEAVSRRP